MGRRGPIDDQRLKGKRGGLGKMEGSSFDAAVGGAEALFDERRCAAELKEKARTI